MSKTKVLESFILAIFLVVPINMFAQQPMGMMHGEDLDLPPVHKGEMKETLRTVMLIEMTSFVGLTDKQALVIAPILDEIEKAKEEQQKKQQENFKKLQDIVDTTKNEKEIKSLIDVLKEDEKKFRENDLELRNKLLQGLEPVKQAKMVLFQVHFKRKMQKIMRYARMQEHRNRIMENKNGQLDQINQRKKRIMDEGEEQLKRIKNKKNKENDQD